MTKAEYIQELRAYIKDKPELNRLLKFAAENDDTTLSMYIEMALGFLNSVPPPIGWIDYDAFPFPALLIHQASIECMISNSIVSARNDVTYNNGGITLKVSDGARYLNLIQVVLRMTDKEIEMWRQAKISYNINGGWGNVFSPYSRLHGKSQSLSPNTILGG